MMMMIGIICIFVGFGGGFYFFYQLQKQRVKQMHYQGKTKKAIWWKLIMIYFGISVSILLILLLLIQLRHAR